MSLQTHIDRIHEIAKDSTIQVILSIDPEIISWKHYYMVVDGYSEEKATWKARMRGFFEQYRPHPIFEQLRSLTRLESKYKDEVARCEELLQWHVPPYNDFTDIYSQLVNAQLMIEGIQHKRFELQKKWRIVPRQSLTP